MSASERIGELIRRTAGSGNELVAVVEVDQVYAEIQHEALEFKHPRGGRAKYLEGPMFEGYASWFQNFAGTLLDEGAYALDGWHEVGRNLKGVVAENAPVEFGDLKQSADLKIKEGRGVVIHEPALQPRLTDLELEGKDYMRSLGMGYR